MINKPIYIEILNTLHKFVHQIYKEWFQTISRKATRSGSMWIPSNAYAVRYQPGVSKIPSLSGHQDMAPSTVPDVDSRLSCCSGLDVPCGSHYFWEITFPEIPNFEGKVLERSTRRSHPVFSWASLRSLLSVPLLETPILRISSPKLGLIGCET